MSKTIPRQEMKKLIVTLPDGRHRTNLDVLISHPEVRKHFRGMIKIVKEHLAREKQGK